MTRREFIRLAATAGAMLPSLAIAGTSDESAGNSTSEGQMQYRTLGHTGEKVSIVGLGGYHMAVTKDPNESIRIVRTAIDGGINFMDNCWDYHNGESEVRMGNALRDGYRDKVFLMTKIDSHSKAGAAKQIPDDFRISITNPPGKQAFPISSFTYLLIPSQIPDAAKGEAIKGFLQWMLADGQKYAAGLFYAPLPKEVVAKEIKQIAQVNAPGGPAKKK